MAECNIKHTPEFVDEICSYILDGESQTRACIKAGLHPPRFFEWKKKFPWIKERAEEAQKAFRENILAELEASLWKKAKGFEITETEIIYGAAKIDKDGHSKPVIKGQRVKKKQIPPDTAALIFALGNVAPTKWINRKRTEITARTQEDEDNEIKFENVPKDLLFQLADALQDGANKEKQMNQNKGA